MKVPPQAPTLQDVWADLPGLEEALRDPRYREAVRQTELRHRHWAKVRYIARHQGIRAEPLWAMIKIARQARYRFLPLKGAGQQVLRYVVPDPLQEELMRIDQQLAGRLVASDDQPLSPAHQERFIVSALREEAIASSMLEGAATTRRDAKEMLQSERRPRTRGERMVLNNYRAISFIREHRATPLTPEFVVEVQRILTEDTLDDPAEVGRFRRPGERIYVEDAYGQVMHEPPRAEELAERMMALCEFANGLGPDESFVHPVVRACVIHFQIGFDHPFCDGNGRTARALFYWSMLRAGYWLFEYLPISRLIYASPGQYALAYLYSETDEFDVTYFLMYKARIIARARKELGAYIAGKQREMSEARQLSESDQRLNHRQRELLLRLLRSPHASISIQEHQGRHSVAYATARSDLLQLAEWEYLRRIVSGRKFEFVRGAALDRIGK